MSEVIDPYKNLKDHLLAIPADAGLKDAAGNVIPIGKAAHFAVELITNFQIQLEASNKLLRTACYPMNFRRQGGD